MFALDQSLEAHAQRPIWRLPPPVDSRRAAAFAEVLGVHPLLAMLLLRRGIGCEGQARALLEPSLAHLHDPFLMADMEPATERVAQAIRRSETIAVYGDYDVDGVTSVALMTSFLRASGASVIPYIPRRLVEGYGLNRAAVEELAGAGARLLVTCDCGVTAVEEIERANELGLDVVVVDHHRCAERLPPARAILNPKRPDCSYPFGELAAVGVAFKLLMALRRKLRDSGYFARGGREEPNLKDVLDIVALGTVSDVVPLAGENRTLVSIGLRVLAEGRRVGLHALKAVSGVENGALTAGQLAFRLGPRINAAGRLDDAAAGLDLLLCREPFEAARLASMLDDANRRRQEIEQGILEEALQQAASVDPSERGLVLHADGWHPGVVGIVASRVSERLRRPTLILGRDGDVLRGSGRSVGGFHLHEALSACARHLTRFGGHRAAAGLELPAAALDAFRSSFLDYCKETVTDADLERVIETDGELDPSSVDEEIVSAIDRLAPFGAGNPAPVFIARDERLEASRYVGKPGADGSRHLKCRLKGVDAIGFGLGEAGMRASGGADVAYTVGFNTWRGERRVQLGLKGIVPSGGAIQP